MNKNIIKPSILPGFMELLPSDQKKFNDIVKRILEVYENNGCLAIDTPIIEKEEVLLAKTGGETRKEVYRFQKGSNNLALRFDLTVPFARYVAQYYNELTFPLRRYQIGKVYRGERPQKGRYRELYQCDVDVIGKNKLSINNDAWVISLASKAFKAIELKKYKFQISNRKILKGILCELKVDEQNEILTLIDKYYKIGGIKFEEELTIILGKDKSDYLISVLGINGTNDEILDMLSKLSISSCIFKEGIDELKKVKAALKILGVDDSEYAINLKIIRGLDYYTGTIFETFLVDSESYGSICSGGRYDNLAENYTENILPGVGISIGLTRLFFVLKEIGFVDAYDVRIKTEYLIIPIGDTLEYCGAILKKLQQKGYGATIYFEDDSLKKKMNYANKLGIDNVIFVGEDEETNKEVKIKNMKLGLETKVTFNEM